MTPIWPIRIGKMTINQWIPSARSAESCRVAERLCAPFVGAPVHGLRVPFPKKDPIPIGSMYAIYGNIYHQYTPNASIYTIHGSYGIGTECSDV